MGIGVQKQSHTMQTIQLALFALMAIAANGQNHCFSCSKLPTDDSGRCYPNVIGRTAEDASQSMDQWGGHPVDAPVCGSGRCYVEKDSFDRYHRDCIDGQPLYRNRSSRCHTIQDPDADWGGDTVICICDDTDSWTYFSSNYGWQNRCNWDDWNDPYDCQPQCTGGCRWSGEGNCDGGCDMGWTYDNVYRRCYDSTNCNVNIGGDCSGVGANCCFGSCGAGNGCCTSTHTFCTGDSECCSGNCVNMGLWENPDSTGYPYWSECRDAGYTWNVVIGNTGK